MSSEGVILRLASVTLQQVAQQIEDVVEGLPGQGMSELTEAAKIRHLLSARRDRERYFDSCVFGEPAWDGLLELYLADISHRSMTATDFCTGSRAAFTTGLRVIDRLHELGVVERAHDPQDRRKALVRLTGTGRERMAAYMDALR